MSFITVCMEWVAKMSKSFVGEGVYVFVGTAGEMRELIAARIEQEKVLRAR